MSRKNPPTSFLSFPDLRQKRVILFIPAARVESAVRAARLLDAAVKAEHAFPCFAVPPLPPFLFLFFSFFFFFFFFSIEFATQTSCKTRVNSDATIHGAGAFD